MPKEKRMKVPTDGQQYVLIEAPVRKRTSLERRAFVQGLFNELSEQVHRYLHLNEQLLDFQARITIVERNLRLTREHLKAVLSEAEEDVPDDWETVLRQVRFVGARLGVACVEILREHRRLSIDEILHELNRGQFRFRTGTPLREINAALLRQPQVERHGDQWVFREKRKR